MKLGESWKAEEYVSDVCRQLHIFLPIFAQNSRQRPQQCFISWNSQTDLSLWITEVEEKTASREQKLSKGDKCERL